MIALKHESISVRWPMCCAADYEILRLTSVSKTRNCNLNTLQNLTQWLKGQTSEHAALRREVSEQERESALYELENGHFLAEAEEQAERRLRQIGLGVL